MSQENAPTLAKGGLAEPRHKDGRLRQTRLTLRDIATGTTPPHLANTLASATSDPARDRWAGEKVNRLQTGGGYVSGKLRAKPKLA